MQHRIVIFKMQNIQYLPKKRTHDQQKNMINKTLQNIGKNAILSVYHAVFGGYHPALSTFHYCGKYRGKIPDGHSKPIYLVLKPLKKSGTAF